MLFEPRPIGADVDTAKPGMCTVPALCRLEQGDEQSKLGAFLVCPEVDAILARTGPIPFADRPFLI
jgi:hypothetical protein